MPRVSKQHEDAVRARILDAGIRAFDEKGLRRASMAAIAADVGLSSGALYTYFDSKEALFLEAFATLVAAEDAAMVQAISADRPTEERIRLAIDYFVDAAVAPSAGGLRGVGGGFLVHAWVNAAESPPLRLRLVDRRRQLEGVARMIIEAGMARGELPADLDVDGLAGGIGSMLDGLLIQRAEQGESFGREQARRQAYAVIDAILRA